MTGRAVVQEPTVLSTPADSDFDLHVGTLVIGAGASGLVAAIAAKEQGSDVLVVERDTVPAGSTALSAGLIPAAGTRHQIEAGISDSADVFADDIQRKARYENEQWLVNTLAGKAATVIDWLSDRYGLAFSVIDNFDYPGHSCRRMHGLPSRSGTELINALRQVAELLDVDIVCQRYATTLYIDGDKITGVLLQTPTGDVEKVQCDKLILACNGFGGNSTLVSRYMPEIKDALWFGHDGNKGEAILWGEQLGAKTRSLGAYQGHGNVATPHGVLVTWAVITEGGIQVNRHGDRFWDESQGYSEAARAVLGQPDAIAFTVFDERIAKVAHQFEDFKQALQMGAVKQAETLPDLARELSLPLASLQASIDSIPLARDEKDAFGRHFPHQRLAAPYYGVKVTGALFHTQGGLAINAHAQVLKQSGEPFANLYAGGGAACGVSGHGDSGYLSGNGLLSAVVLGYLAGRH